MRAHSFSRATRPRMGSIAPVLAACALAAAGGVAHADAIEGPPEDCPAGSTGTSSHTDTYCMPSSCPDDAFCTAPSDRGTERELFCTANVGLCIESRTAMPGGRFPDGVAPTPITYEVARAACTTDADCTAPAHCVVTSRCTPRTALQFVSGAFGCAATRAGSPRSSPTAGLALASAAVAVSIVARGTRRSRLR